MSHLLEPSNAVDFVHRFLKIFETDEDAKVSIAATFEKNIEDFNKFRTQLTIFHEQMSIYITNITAYLASIKDNERVVDPDIIVSRNRSKVLLDFANELSQS
jgi:hypothetical protein